MRAQAASAEASRVVRVAARSRARALSFFKAPAGRAHVGVDERARRKRAHHHIIGLAAVPCLLNRALLGGGRRPEQQVVPLAEEGKQSVCS